jgi:hypothetical protein
LTGSLSQPPKLLGRNRNHPQIHDRLAGYQNGAFAAAALGISKISLDFRQDPVGAFALEGRYKVREGTSDAVTKGSVYGGASFIVIGIVAPGNRNCCGDLHFRGAVFDADHFVDAAGGYSDVDTFFRTGSCALRFVTSRTKGLEELELLFSAAKFQKTPQHWIFM